MSGNGIRFNAEIDCTILLCFEYSFEKLEQ